VAPFQGCSLRSQSTARPPGHLVPISAFKFQVSGFWFLVSGFPFFISTFQISTFQFQHLTALASRQAVPPSGLIAARSVYRTRSLGLGSAFRFSSFFILHFSFLAPLTIPLPSILLKFQLSAFRFFSFFPMPRLLLISSILLLAAVAYCSLTASPEMVRIPWIPKGVGDWADSHTTFRNFPPFAFLSAVLYLALLLHLKPEPGRGLWLGVGVAVLVTLLGVALEVAQLWIPTRVCDVRDIAWSGVGAFVGVAVVYRVKGVWR
jgi:VanZ family protein